MSIGPILNAAKYIPFSMVLKGLEKVNPKFKNYFTEAASYGLDANRALEYLTNRFQNPTDQSTKNSLDRGADEGTLRPDEMEARQRIATSEMPGKALKSVVSFGGSALAGMERKAPQMKEEGVSGEMQPEEIPEGNMQTQQMNQVPKSASANFITKHPELGAFLDKLIQSGQSPIQAAQTAKQHKKWGQLVSQIENSVGEDFVTLIGRLYGMGEQQGMQQQSQQNSQEKTQFMQGLSDLAQMMQTLKGQR